jgi:hypothetical protein
VRRDVERTSPFRIAPANEASWENLQAVFGSRGDPSRCYCQRYKMQPRESWASVGAEELGFRFRTQTECGDPNAGATSGLVAYVEREPVGWCAVEPRTAYPRLLLKTRVPWEGRAQDKTDDSVWAVTCFVTRTGFRRQGVCRALARATGRPLGRAPRRQPQRLRRRRLQRGQPPHAPPGRDADRLLGGHAPSRRPGAVSKAAPQSRSGFTSSNRAARPHGIPARRVRAAVDPVTASGPSAPKHR